MKLGRVLPVPDTRGKTGSHRSRPAVDLLALLCVVASTSVSAEWMKIGAARNDSPDIFIDTETIRQTGPMNTMRRVWELHHLAARAPNRALSLKKLVEYDCKDRRVRVLGESSFTEHWAQGDVLASTVHDSQSAKWAAVGTRGVSQTLFKRVCPHDGPDPQAR